MALSLSYPSAQTGEEEEESTGIFEDEEAAEKCRARPTNKISASSGAACLEDDSEESEMDSQSQSQSERSKPWKSTPSLNLMNKSGSGEDQRNKLGGGASSHIPVPISKKPVAAAVAVAVDKQSLQLENLINSNSNSQSGSVKTLPDVTESPQTPFGSSDKPCDLLAQLEIVKRQREMETSTSSGGASPTGGGESDSVDDNGNPVEVELGEEKEETGTETTTPENEKSQSVSVSVSISEQQTVSSKAEPQPQPQQRPLTFGESLSEKLKSPEEPKYFINAAALSEDTFELPPSPAPSPCSSHFSSLNYVDPYPSLCPFVPDRSKEKEEVAGTSSSAASTQPKLEKSSSQPKDSSSSSSAASVRPRVPVSKSFPDIVQTTFTSDDKDGRASDKTTKDNSDTESLVADSLEDVRQTEEKKPAEEELKPLKAFEQPLPAYPSFDPMTESQIGGISAEKPPEAWVIDFNSLSLESDLMESSRSDRKSVSSMGSNPNSLAFFVNLDDKSQIPPPPKDPLTESTDKKIFTMFVDLGSAGAGVECPEKDKIPESQMKSSDSDLSLMSASMTMGSASGSGGTKQQQQQRSSGLINKPVMNIMETSGCGLGLMKYPMSRRFPSPIFQHRAAAEASRKAARMELNRGKEKQHHHHKEQFLDSLEPTSSRPVVEDIMLKSQLQLNDSTSSNRSSLHVANVLDASFTSSLLSSMENSSPADLEVCQGGPCFKLGKDLLRMFQEGINTDVNIVVNGKCIKAHKCILASRSQYFAAILSGNWVENAGNTINLDGFSYTVVQFTMYHIYSGTNEIPDTIDLLELATLTDLLGLEGLRENISQTIRQKFCHNFHRPCTGCIAGVIECFPIAIAYGMDELHRKMTKWICKHFVRIWPTKAFAMLGDELIEKCLRYSVNHLSVDNILDHTLGCDQLLTTMPTVRWTEPIFSIVGQLSEACVQYIGEHFCEVLQSEKFLLFGKGQTWNISRIEGTFMEALNLLKPDEACLSHTALARLIELGTETIDEVEWSTLFVDFLKMLRGEIERYLLANASKAVLCKGWEQLGNDVRKKICTSSFMGYDKYGNKIVKNQGSHSGSGHHGHGHHQAQPTTTTVPVQNVKPTTKERQSNYGHGHSRSSGSKATASRQMSVPVTTTVTKEPNKEPILSPITTNPAKVASVKPMQAQATASGKSHQQQPPQQQQPAPTSSSRAVAGTTKPRSSSTGVEHSQPHPRENKTLSRVTSQNKFNAPTSSNAQAGGTHRASGSVPRKFTSVEREKSFSSSPRSSSSASRTPMKPLTPSKTDSPIVQHGTIPVAGGSGGGGVGTYGRSTASSRRAATQKIPPVPPAQQKPTPPAKVFLTNSAKAAAVSKPNLRGSSKRTPSSSSLISQHPSVASSKTSVNAPVAQPRYLNTREASRGGFSARSSFSNVERPAGAPATTAPVASTRTKAAPRRNTYSNAPSTQQIQHANRNPTVTTTSGATKRPLSGGSIGQHAAGAVGLGNSSTPANRNMTEVQNNYAKDNVMSRSTIETDSGETKMRTLAEIGRSSTFSKDEPTILGKMDSSTYSTLDMEISP